MAKSIRSKRKRKMRNIKREKYGKREVERLKGIIEAAKNQDEEMTELYTGINHHFIMSIALLDTLIMK